MLYCATQVTELIWDRSSFERKLMVGAENWMVTQDKKKDGYLAKFNKEMVNNQDRLGNGKYATLSSLCHRVKDMKEASKVDRWKMCNNSKLARESVAFGKKFRFMVERGILIDMLKAIMEYGYNPKMLPYDVLSITQDVARNRAIISLYMM